MSSRAGHHPRPRPAWLRALGHADPPPEVTIGDRRWSLERIIKHDSWAATAIYWEIDDASGASSAAPTRRQVVKFNRVQPLGIFPLRWLGRRLASREAWMYERLAGVPGIVAGHRDVFAAGCRLPHAVAHDFIEGHPLRWHDRPGPEFFESLHQTLLAIHARGIAYVDLNKWENIIVDPAGQPHLIDFQISLSLPRIGPLSSLLRVFQRCDLYHLSKHASRVCPQHFSRDHFAPQPWWILLHRRIAEPFRAFRRSLLVRLGVRRGAGKPQSEQFIEEGLRITGAANAPIEQLYGLLASAEYQSSVTRRGGDFFLTLFTDLIGRPPVNELEQQFVRSFATRPRHDQIVWLFKSDLFLAHTSQWSPSRIAAVEKSLKVQLDESLNQAA